MKFILLLLVFLYFTKLAFADYFFENSVCFLTLEKKKIKEILGLKEEETIDSETNKGFVSKIKEILGLKAKENSELAVYKKVVSQIKENYSIDLDNDIKQISLFLFPGYLNFYLVIDGDFESEKIQNNIKNAIESKKWRYHKFEDFDLCGNNFQALRINGYNLVFYDKNTLIFCKDSVEDNDSIKISKIPDSIKDLEKISKNYLWVSKDIQKTPGIGLEKSNYCIGYIKDNQLVVEAGFNDYSEAKKVIENYNNIPKKQIETLNQNIKSYLEKAKEESSNLREGLIPNILFNLLESVYSRLYIHLKAKKLLDFVDISSEETKIIDCLKTKFNAIYIARNAVCFYLSAKKNTDDDGKNNDFVTEVEGNKKIRCFFIQRVVLGAIEMYDLDNCKEPMTTLDIPLLVKGKYLQERDMPNKDCELYSVGNLTENGYIACKTHGSYYLESIKYSGQ